jgi:DNA-binding FadR family transcriptional regulator
MAATDKALAGLRQMIASGTLGPGEKFPPEPELCDRLGVSRSSCGRRPGHWPRSA